MQSRLLGLEEENKNHFHKQRMGDKYTFVPYQKIPNKEQKYIGGRGLRSRMSDKMAGTITKYKHKTFSQNVFKLLVQRVSLVQTGEGTGEEST